MGGYQAATGAGGTPESQPFSVWLNGILLDEQAAFRSRAVQGKEEGRTETGEDFRDSVRFFSEITFVMYPDPTIE
jgi:hypothetical protein